MKSLTKALIFFLVFSVLQPHVFAKYSCSDFQDQDLIVMFSESVREVKQNDYMTESDIPEGWKITNEGNLTKDEIEVYRASRDLPVGIYDTGITSFYFQVLTSTSNAKDIIYVNVESFRSAQNAEDVYRHYKNIFAKADNYANSGLTRYDETTEYGVKGFISWVQGTGAVYKFIDSKNRFIQVTGGNEAGVMKIAAFYGAGSKALNVVDTLHYKAEVCESQTGECTRKFYFSPLYDRYVVKECFTMHGTEKVACPEERMKKYSNLLEIPFPVCEKGDVIELVLETKSVFPITGEIWSPEDIYFGASFPVEDQRLVLKVPNTLSIKQYSTQGMEPTVTKGGIQTLYVWRQQSILPYEEEELMPDEREVFPRVSYTSLESWDEFIEWETGLFEESFDIETVKGSAKALVSGSDSREQKTRKVYDWVRNEIRYEDNEIGFLKGYQPHEAGEVLNLKFGDCKDHTTLLVSMLKSLGIEAYPALVARPALNTQTPSPYEFYHSIAYVPSGDGGIWLDPTCKFCPYGYLPVMEQGADALILQGKGSFVKLPSSERDKKARTEVDYSIYLSGDLSAKANISFSMTGTYGLSLVSQLNGTTSQEKKKELLSPIVKYICPDFDIEDLQVLDPTDDLSASIHMRVRCKNIASRSGEKLVYNIPDDSMYQKAVDKASRKYPLVIKGSDSVVLSQRIFLPAGYVVDLLPDAYAAEKAFASYGFGCGLDGSSVVCGYNISEKEIRLEPSGFAEFRDFYRKVNALKKTIVLKPSAGGVLASGGSDGSASGGSQELTGSGGESQNKGSGQGQDAGLTDGLSPILLGIIAVLVVALLVSVFLRRREPPKASYQNAPPQSPKQAEIQEIIQRVDSHPTSKTPEPPQVPASSQASQQKSQNPVPLETQDQSLQPPGPGPKQTAGP